MTIYRCDKCHKEMANRADLYRIRAVSEWYDDSPGEHYWNESNKTEYFDVCKECEETLLWWFNTRFDLEEGGVKNGSNENDSDSSNKYSEQ